MDRVDRAYFLARAEAELERGEQAASRCAADAHFELAGRYFDIAFGARDNGEEPPCAPTIAAAQPG